MVQIEAYDNSPRLLYDMDCYGVDMCIVEPAFGMTNETNVEQKKKHPDKFVCNCWPHEYRDRAMRGEIEWTIDGFCEEMERLLQTGDYVGVGESAIIPVPKEKTKYPEYLEERTIIRYMMQVLDVCRQYKVPFLYHLGTPGGYAIPYHGSPATFNPLWAHTLAATYPDVQVC